MAVTRPRTGAEAYLKRQLQRREYVDAYRSARARIAQVDEVVRSIDSRRQELGMSKAELARRSNLKPEAVRRLLTVGRPNPTLATLASLAHALDLVIGLVPMSWTEWEGERLKKLSRESRRRKRG